MQAYVACRPETSETALPVDVFDCEEFQVLRKVTFLYQVILAVVWSGTLYGSREQLGLSQPPRRSPMFTNISGLGV